MKQKETGDGPFKNIEYFRKQERNNTIDELSIA